jgi:hypothetical protein
MPKTKKVRRGNHFSKKTQPIFVGDLVRADIYVSDPQLLGLIVEVFSFEKEWYAKVCWQNGYTTTVYSSFLHIVSGIEED